MASILIHMCVAKEINKKIKVNEDKLLLGSIIPDQAKRIKISRDKTHFIQKDNIPNLDMFLEKYKKNIKDEFVLGYYIHIYTDYLWNKYFVPELITNDKIKALNGEVIECDDSLYKELIYNDYNYLNGRLEDRYNIDLKLFSNPINTDLFPIEEIDIYQIPYTLNQFSMDLMEEKKDKYIFDLKDIEQFVDNAAEVIYSDVVKLINS